MNNIYVKGQIVDILNSELCEVGVIDKQISYTPYFVVNPIIDNVIAFGLSLVLHVNEMVKK